MKLNCDLGEGLDQVDRELMPWIDMANIACGGHAGNYDSMCRTVSLAAQHQVSIGAHPSYPDKDNFGRQSMIMSADSLANTLTEQIHSLREVCQAESISLAYIKPHGALYHDLLVHEELLALMLTIARQMDLPLMLQAMLDNKQHQQLAKQYQVSLLWEGFADRRYTDAGHLVPRQQKHALLSVVDEVVEQAHNFTVKQGVFSENLRWLPINVDCLCVHSDTENAVELISALKKYLARLGDS